MTLHGKTVKKELMFFKYEEINSETIEHLIEFCKKHNDVLISNIIIDLLNNEPRLFTIGLNVRGTVMNEHIEPDTYYYFRGHELRSTDDPDNIEWW